jgi:hypothetical protein
MEVVGVVGFKATLASGQGDQVLALIGSQWLQDLGLLGQHLQRGLRGILPQGTARLNAFP